MFPPGLWHTKAAAAATALQNSCEHVTIALIAKEFRMTRARNIIGLIAAVFIVLSSAAHSLLGWKALGARLAATTAPADLTRGLRIGWQFGGAAMLALGIILAAIFIRRVRGEVVDALPALVIGMLYAGFGGWALAVSGLQPFFANFVILGAMLLFAAWPR